MTLKDLRENLAYNQTYVAGYCGVTEVTVSRWENGQNEPRPHQIRMLSQLYGVSIADVRAAIRATAEKPRSE